MDCRRRAGKFAYGCFDHPAKLGLDLPRIFFGDDAPVEAQRDAVRHDIRVDATLDQADGELRAADACRGGEGLAETLARGIKRREHLIRCFQRVDAGERHRSMSRATLDLDLEMEATVMCGHDGIGKACANREIRTRDTLL